jgi:hypothetical protein
LINERQAKPGAALSRDIASGERAEADLDAFISRRHNQRVGSEGEHRQEELWQESARRHEAAKRAENVHAWREYHLAAAPRHTTTLFLSLIEHHERGAERCLSAEGAA